MASEINRRDFVTAGLAASAAVALACTHVAPTDRPRSVPEDATILFQGDSITDAGRDRAVAAANIGPALGGGYPLLLAADMLRADPGRGLRFLNRGVSGNKVPDLAARWETDTLALRPTIVSILIGVNDYWHKRLNGYAGTVADYETGFLALLERTRAHLPRTRLIVMEPFVLPTGVVDAGWLPELDERRAAAARVAARAGATFVRLQAAFTAAASTADASVWTADGVHPTPAGHALIAERWRADTGL
jgi:lysophospholipase L1-like esterase